MTLDNYGKIKLADDARKKIAQRLHRLIDAAESEKRGYLDSWRTDMENFTGASMFQVPFMEGISGPTFNIVSPRVTALSDNVVGKMTSMSPIATAKVRGSSERMEQLEQAQEFFQEMANIDAKLRQIAILCGIQDMCAVRTTYEHVESGVHSDVGGMGSPASPFVTYSGLHHEVIPIEEFVFCRSGSCDISTTPLIGHRFKRLRRDVDMAVELERYYDHKDLIAATDHDNPVRQFTDQNAADGDSGDKVDEVVSLYDVIFRARPDELGLTGKDESYYHAIVSYDDQVLLCLKPFHLRRPNYSLFRMSIPLPGSLYSATSLANRLQPYQAHYNHTMYLRIYGAYYSAFPSVATTGIAGKSKPIRPAQLVEVDGNEIKMLNTDFDASGLKQITEDIERIADAESGISQAGIAQEFSSGTTATEVENVAAGQAMRLQGYGAQLGTGVEDLYAVSQEILRIEAEIWAPLYKDQLMFTSELLTDLEKPIRWEVTGKKPDATPKSMLEKLRFLYDMASAGSNPQGLVELAAGFMEQYGIPPESIQSFIQEAASQTGPFDMDELMRSIVNSLNLPNATRIYKGNNEPGEGESNSIGTQQAGGNPLANAIFGGNGGPASEQTAEYAA